MNLNILDIAPIISDISMCRGFLRGRNLLLSDYFCCNETCSKVMDCSLSDNEIFQCKICFRRFSIRTGSFWEKSKLPLTILVGLLYFFCNGSTIKEVLSFFDRKITKPTAIQWFNYFRDIMTTYLINFPVTFDNCTVHIDETFIGGKRKYSKGKFPKCKPRYIFGIINKEQHKVYLQFVTKRDHRTLIPIIRNKVTVNCQINSDGASVCKILSNLGYNHKTVIHETNFVNPVDGTHTNSIENFWSNLKAKLKVLRGSQKKMLDGHLDEFVYRYNRKHQGSVFELMLQDISRFYPV